MNITNSVSQTLEVNISNLHYQNGNSINDCGDIDFQLNSSITLVFDVELTRPSAQATGDGYIYIYTIENPAFSKIERANSYVPSSIWFNDTYTLYHMEIELFAYDYDISGGVFYANYTTIGGASYDSCHHPIIKDEVPTFEINPSSTSVSCGSNNPKTFSVTNVYNSPGNLEYHWNVGNGWKRNGSIVHTFTTTTNNINLEPYQFPPSDVQVTPVLDGVSYGVLTSNVSLSDFNTNNQIVGSSSICTTGTYHLQNSLSSGYSVIWSVSNNSIASITQTGNTATVTANPTQSGAITVNATIKNPCNQTTTKTLDVFVGSPSFTGNITGESNPIVGEVKTYTMPPANGATSYDWYFDVGNFQTGTNIDGWQIIQGQGSTNVLVKIGNPGNAVIVCRATNSCSNKIKYKYVNPRTQPDPCDELLRISSNPIKSDSQNKIIILINDPCDDVRNNIGNLKERTLNIYNNTGELAYSKTQSGNEFDINHLKKGLYFVKYQTIKGKMITKKIIVQ